jgi:hypothetical protein
MNVIIKKYLISDKFICKEVMRFGNIVVPQSIHIWFAHSGEISLWQGKYWRSRMTNRTWKNLFLLSIEECNIPSELPSEKVFQIKEFGSLHSRYPWKWYRSPCMTYWWVSSRNMWHGFNLQIKICKGKEKLNSLEITKKIRQSFLKQTILTYHKIIS